jgi:hypothetical protein
MTPPATTSTTSVDGPSAHAPAREVRLAWLLLALTAVAFLGFDLVFVPRLSNVHFGDVEFTGWSGPIGSRLLPGDRPYVDFVLPIPPGSFALLALLEKLAGRPRLLHELWLNTSIHLAMALLAYAMARAVTSPKNAVLTAIATLSTVVQLNKECAYDHTAQLVAWGSVACGLFALVSQKEARRHVYWVLAGFFASFTLAFKQSTAIGCVFGWLLALGYLAGADWASGERERARAWVVPLVKYARGVGLGLGAVWLLLVLLGSTARAFVQAVFLDASILKGGTRFLLKNLAVYLFDYAAYPGSLAFLVIFGLVGLRLLGRRGTLHVGDERGRASAYRGWEIVATAVSVTATFGAGAFILVKGPHGYPVEWIYEIDRLKQLPAVGLVTASALFVAHLVRTDSGSAEPATLRTGHALNATLIAAFVCSLMHNTSAPEFRPYYDNNAIIPLTFITLFVVLDRADLRWLSAALLVLFLGSIAGNKYFRAMTATNPMARDTHWAGMRASEHGVVIARAAARARELAGEHGTVLVLPEDVEVSGLIGRPRPPLLGAIVFVDQYAPRLARDDIARLDENPPNVLVIHPRQVRGWQRFFRIWSGRSGAEQVVSHVLYDLIPKRYRRDSSYPTTFLWEPGTLDVYVRRDGPLADGEQPAVAVDDEDAPEIPPPAPDDDTARRRQPGSGDHTP